MLVIEKDSKERDTRGRDMKEKDATEIDMKEREGIRSTTDRIEKDIIRGENDREVGQILKTLSLHPRPGDCVMNLEIQHQNPRLLRPLLVVSLLEHCAMRLRTHPEVLPQFT